MVGRESPMEEAKRKLREVKGRGEKIRGKYKTFNFLVDVAGDELELANDAYMKADTEEAWTEFNEHCERACLNLRCSMETLHELAETEPSCVDQKTIRWIEETIDEINNLRIGFWQKWGKRVKADREAGRRPTGVPQCPAQILHGIDDMMSERAIRFCEHECEYADRCVLPVPKP